ncbi:MAG: MOSC N-terminal beta barrel domain-containing protein [Pseudomonadota bacterium]
MTVRLHGLFRSTIKSGALEPLIQPFLRNKFGPEATKQDRLAGEKGRREISAQTFEITRNGVEGDRQFMVIDKNGKLYTQNQNPAMAHLRAFVEDGRFHYQFKNASVHGSRSFGSVGEGIDLASLQDTQIVKYRQEEPFKALVLPDRVNEELSAFLTTAGLRLVMRAPNFERDVSTHHGGKQRTLGGFQDQDAISVVGLNTCEDVQCLRPNIVLSGLEPHEEDRIEILKIGDVVLKRSKPIVRCPMIDVDPQRGTYDKNNRHVTDHFKKSGRNLTFEKDRMRETGIFAANRFEVVTPGLITRNSRIEITFNDDHGLRPRDVSPTGLSAQAPA